MQRLWRLWAKSILRFPKQTSKTPSQRNQEVTIFAAASLKDVITKIGSEFSKEPYIDMPTCGVAIFKFNTDSWKNISAENLVSEKIDDPKKAF